jgi:hypothetical protein
VIPPFNRAGQLPPGSHEATWEEIVLRYGYTPQRRQLLGGIERVITDLRAAGCRRLFLDGSFITSKERPNDFDGCWLRTGVNLSLLHPVLLDTAYPRAAQKARYGGELFPAYGDADGIGTTYLDFFQLDKLSGKPKGILALTL